MRQKHGQNFLVDSGIANKIVRAANLNERDRVLEIGPGKGILTRIIQPKVKHLTAVEIDNSLARQLTNYFSFHNVENISIVNADFLKFSMESGITSGKNIPQPSIKIISNLPYNVGTAIIQKILLLQNWTIAIFMLQKELVQRLVSGPSSKKYGYISIITSYYTEAKILFDVLPKCFNPKPKIISSVIKLTNKRVASLEPIFYEVVKHVFNMRRKTILNGLSSFKGLGKSRALQVVNNCNLHPFLRPEMLSVSDFLHLTNTIKQYTICRA